MACCHVTSGHRLMKEITLKILVGGMGWLAPACDMCAEQAWSGNVIQYAVKSATQALTVSNLFISNVFYNSFHALDCQCLINQFIESFKMDFVSIIINRCSHIVLIICITIVFHSSNNKSTKHFSILVRAECVRQRLRSGH